MLFDVFADVSPLSFAAMLSPWHAMPVLHACRRQRQLPPPLMRHAADAIADFYAFA